ncbi:MarR family transcriptional regulator [Terricaulis sp.]|uniref:MarR family winged helix-turn-helix transcriptional regulator n=1 Tax=Terricaulis sp. TaxID=2768686 RepID=UPI002AC6B91F|nr:MarR family transcriptional regulator [Terricaulis sp.]MDZ4690140.1 MarR family transcriptional regulator [Terricaulis sp.]
MAKPRFLHLLSRAARAAQGVADEGLGDLNLTSAQAGALFTIPAEGGASVNSISESLGLAQSAASVLVQRLEQAGLIERQTDPADRRAVLITLTARGRSLRTRAIERAHRMNTAAARGFSSDEQAIIARWLQYIIDLKEERP